MPLLFVPARRLVPMDIRQVLLRELPQPYGSHVVQGAKSVFELLLLPKLEFYLCLSSFRGPKPFMRPFAPGRLVPNGVPAIYDVLRDSPVLTPSFFTHPTISS
jgi:hypothetical protein